MSDDTGAVLLQHYRDQLAAERDRKQSLERRGQAVVGTNGAIVSLLFAFGTVDINTTTASGRVAAAAFVAAMVSLVVSAALGLHANRPEMYAETNADMLLEVAQSPANWTGGLKADEAQRQVATDIAKVIKYAKGKNGRKGTVVRLAVDGQVLGLTLLAVTLVLSIFFVDQGQGTPVTEPSEKPAEQEPAAGDEEPPVDTQLLFGEPAPVLEDRPPSLFGQPFPELRSRELERQRKIAEDGDRSTPESPDET